MEATRTEAQDPARTEETLVRARAGDGEAFRRLTDPYRTELQVHCYRMVGSVQDAEDLLQETLLAAWRGLGGYEGRASVRTWLYRIATNRCLNALRDGARRPAAVPGRNGKPPLPEATRERAEPLWLEPYPDALLDGVPDGAPGPEARYEMRESVSLAFMVALQQLPATQRAVLVLREVLGFRAAEVAEMLATSESAVTSALKRARAAVAGELPGADLEEAPLPGSSRERRIVDGFARAFERGDVDAVVALLTDDAWLTMPPVPLEYQGIAAARNFLSAVAMQEGRTFVLLPTRANGQPAFATYVCDPEGAPYAHGLLVLTLRGDQVSAVTRFPDTRLLPVFGMPQSLHGGRES
ncbi:sigma-70 family RNA polymerase sigma factor [Streptomyces sp. V4-01]|uniref:RNA polymerase sigma factor n=1 Tax=Actinacidiphila polyblastidii TaxID=3110430 RepID=A0ABU7PIP9_9ACTN|nr:sigma-70 family RNA polymerase sigma factor [Streptomyces sp. V4-01]